MYNRVIVSLLTRLLFIVFLQVLAGTIIAQSSQGVAFQGVAKDILGNLAKGRKIFIRDAVFQAGAGGPRVWEETFEVTTDENGGYSITVGLGTKAANIQKNSFSSIDWANGPFYLRMEIAVAPSIPAYWWKAEENYMNMGTWPLKNMQQSLRLSDDGGGDGLDNWAEVKGLNFKLNLMSKKTNP